METKPYEAQSQVNLGKLRPSTVDLYDTAVRMDAKRIPSKIEQTLKELDRKLPTGSTAGKWFFIEEDDRGIKRYRIRRSVSAGRKRSHQRFPAQYYQDCKTKALAEEFARFLNTFYGHDPEAERAIEDLLDKNSVVPRRVVEQFKSYRLGEVGNKNSAYKDSIRYIEKAFLPFFLSKSKKMGEWDSPELVGEWRDWLIAHETWSSTSTYRKIVNYSNMFVKFLHDYDREKYPLMVLKPFGKVLMQNIRDEELREKEDGVGEFITEDEFKKILHELDARVVPAAVLAYCFGLRRGEVAGMAGDTSLIGENALQVRYQIDKLVREDDDSVTITKRKTKSKKSRAVPYWFMAKEKVLAYIHSQPVTSVDLISHKFGDVTHRLAEAGAIRCAYRFHDLRHTFITRAFLAGKSIADVKNAAGHSDLRVTSAYVRESEKWRARLDDAGEPAEKLSAEELKRRMLRDFASA
ncbi:MAG: tyrosine-type recombinase/integrase [Oligoflexus sp.]